MVKYTYKAVPFCAKSDAWHFHGVRVAAALNKLIANMEADGYEYFGMSRATTQVNISMVSWILIICTFGLYWWLLSRSKRINQGTVVIFRKAVSTVE